MKKILSCINQPVISEKLQLLDYVELSSVELSFSSFSSSSLSLSKIAKCKRSGTWSFLKIDVKCALTVLSEINSFEAITLLLMPCKIKRTTSRSRADKESKPTGVGFGGGIRVIFTDDDAGNKKSYGAQFFDKAAHGLANVTTGWMELPKNIYIMTRETNVLYGIIGGTGMGVFRTIGRTGLGVFDLITAPIPTDPMVKPGYVWENFGTKTTYGTQFYLEEPVSRTAPQ